MPSYCQTKKHLLYLLTSNNCYVFQRTKNADEAWLNKTDSVEDKITLQSRDTYGLEDQIQITDNTSLNSQSLMYNSLKKSDKVLPNMDSLDSLQRNAVASFADGSS